MPESRGARRNKATTQRQRWPVGSIEAAEAALEEQMAAEQPHPGRGLGTQHSRPHIMPACRGTSHSQERKLGATEPDSMLRGNRVSLGTAAGQASAIVQNAGLSLETGQ